MSTPKFNILFGNIGIDYWMLEYAQEVDSNATKFDNIFTKMETGDLKKKDFRQLGNLLFTGDQLPKNPPTKQQPLQSLYSYSCYDKNYGFDTYLQKLYESLNFNNYDLLVFSEFCRRHINLLNPLTKIILNYPQPSLVLDPYKMQKKEYTIKGATSDELKYRKSFVIASKNQDITPVQLPSSTIDPKFQSALVYVYDTPILIFNIHLRNISTSSPLGPISEIRDRISKYNGDNIIICGDFNDGKIIEQYEEELNKLQIGLQFNKLIPNYYQKLNDNCAGKKRSKRALLAIFYKLKDFTLGIGDVNNCTLDPNVSSHMFIPLTLTVEKKVAKEILPIGTGFDRKKFIDFKRKIDSVTYNVGMLDYLLPNIGSNAQNFIKQIYPQRLGEINDKISEINAKFSEVTHYEGKNLSMGENLKRLTNNIQELENIERTLMRVEKLVTNEIAKEEREGADTKQMKKDLEECQNDIKKIDDMVKSISLDDILSLSIKLVEDAKKYIQLPKESFQETPQYQQRIPKEIYYQEVPQGVPRGVPQGVPRGAPQGAPRGIPQGVPRGIFQGVPRGVPQGIPRGVPQGGPQRIPYGVPQEVPQEVSQYIPPYIPQYPQYIPQYSQYYQYVPQYEPQYNPQYSPQYSPQYGPQYIPQYVPQYYSQYSST